MRVIRPFDYGLLVGVFGLVLAGAIGRFDLMVSALIVRAVAGPIAAWPMDEQLGRAINVGDPVEPMVRQLIMLAVGLLTVVIMGRIFRRFRHDLERAKA